MMNDARPDSVAGDGTSTHLNVGAALRSAREALGLSTQEIADRIKFSVRQVEALEQDDAAHLPQGTFLRGFIRNYARVVHLDPAILLNQTKSQTEHHFDVTDVQAGGDPLPVVGVAERKNRYLLVAALIIAFGLLLFLYSHRDDSLRLIGDYSSKQPAPIIETVSEVAATTENIEVEKAALPATASVDEEPDTPPAADSATAAPSTETLPDKHEIPLEQLMKRPIHILFQDDAWVEIKDVNGEVLISRITEAGGEKWIGGARRAPYQVTIGKAGAVRLYYKGNEIDLSEFKPDSVARLVLE